MRMFKHGFCVLGIMGVLAAPLTLAAVSPTYPPGLSANSVPATITEVNDIPKLVEVIVAWLFWLLLAFSIVMFFIGGYKYVTSSGESEKVQEANKTLLYAAIAVVVAFVALGLPLFISSFFTGGGGNSNLRF